MKRLCLILLLATMAPSAAALTRQQEQVINATGFALFVGDFYSPACAHARLDDVAVQSAWRAVGLDPDRYMDKTHFQGIGCGAAHDSVSDKLCSSYGLALQARNSATRSDKYDDFCRKAWEDFGPSGKVERGFLKERKIPN